jgi:hypothetical protein
VKRALAAALIAAVLGALGLKVLTDEAFSVALYKHRPHLLRYGPKAALGRCTVRETDDPKSDVLSNLIDVDSDGRSDYRLTAFIDASPALCERRRAFWWSAAPMAQCHAASAGCGDP